MDVQRFVWEIDKPRFSRSDIFGVVDGHAIQISDW
jgi:hypothetical protein